MNAQKIAAQYITVPEIVRDLNEPNVTISTVHNWLKYHGYMAYENLVGRPVVLREVYEEFKAARPDKQKAAA